jgi:ketosteroid isomerase-like protein
MSTERNLVDRVRRYYELVDAGEVSSLAALFAEDTVYRRPGYQPIRGRAELVAFYTGERVIETGVHTLSDVVVQSPRVAVNGEFKGVLKDGSDVSLKFADFFAVSEDGLFTERETFFFSPMV